MSKFWADKPCALFEQWNIFPTPELSKDAKLNALTRLVLLAMVVMYAVHFEHWLTLTLVGLIVILLIKYSTSSKTEGFTITPTYTTTNFMQTEVAPAYSEEWQNPPPVYNTYESIPYTEELEDYAPPDKPYAQYITRTNLLPSDEARLMSKKMGATQARTYANSAILRNELAWRDNITRVFKKKLARRFRNSCNDSFSPYRSY